MSQNTISRRDFLKLAQTVLLTASGIAGLAGLWRYFSFETEPPAQTDFEAGPAANFPAGSRTVLANIPAVLLHGSQGFEALSLTCPHLGCMIESKADGYACPCHGSQFDLKGDLKRGPAAKGMARLRVEVAADGHVHVFTK